MVQVKVNVHTNSVTHVADGILKGLKQIVVGVGLAPTWLVSFWSPLELGIMTWLRSGHLQQVILEVYTPNNQPVGRFDFTIDYGYYVDGDGELWLDPATVEYAIRKTGAVPGRCLYRVVVIRLPGYAPVQGWSDTTLRSTLGFSRYSVGATAGGGYLGAALAYWSK